jgi:hypothetical protein
MTENQFRRLALSFPGAVESAHMGHPDFRVGGKIFATLWPARGWAMVRLPIDQQEMFVKAVPGVFEPVKGTWGQRGATTMRLARAQKGMARDALLAAWRERAPRRLLKELSV